MLPRIASIIWSRTPKPHPPTDEVSIARFEVRIGRTLPNDYREFLLAFNGGWLDDRITIRVTAEGQPEDAVQDFFGVDVPAEKTGDLDRHLNLFDEGENTPPIKILLIAGTVGACYVALYLADDDYGAIYYKDFHDWFRIADSFEEFLGLLDPDD